MNRMKPIGIHRWSILYQLGGTNCNLGKRVKNKGSGADPAKGGLQLRRKEGEETMKASTDYGRG